MGPTGTTGTTGAIGRHGPHVQWASWLVTRRAAIDRALAVRRGGDLPRAAAPESEALRRFRSFAAASLRSGAIGAPALDGLRVDPGAAAHLVSEWCRAAEDVAGPEAALLRMSLAPVRARFEAALTGAEAAHAARQAPRPARRAVVGAIDRIADAFLAIDVDTGVIADANPAATALLGAPREALLGAPAEQWVDPPERDRFRTEIGTLAESATPRRFRSTWCDAQGIGHPVELHATRSTSRSQVLALVVARVG
jgi:PAS domain S-box-containing protein